MNRRDNFQAMMNREERGKVLLDLGKRSFHKFVYNKFRAHVGLQQMEPVIVNKMSQCVVPDEDLLELLDVDFRWLYPAWTDIKEVDEHSYRSPFGVLFRENEEGAYFAVADAPMGTLNDPEDIDKYESWPDPNITSPYEHLVSQAEYLEKNSDYLIGLDGIRGGILQTAIELRGFNPFFVDLVINKEYVNVLLNKILDIYKGYYSTYLSMLGKYGDVIFVQDDFGMQSSMMMSPGMWREMIRPKEAELIRHIKALAPHIKVIFHSDGSILPIIGDLAEIGVDFLNPIQTSLEEFTNTYKLNSEYGECICFHGGIDVQKVMTESDPTDVRLDVNRRICDLGKNGGYVITTCHNINVDIPVENLKAMYDAIKEFRSYPLRRLE